MVSGLVDRDANVAYAVKGNSHYESKDRVHLQLIVIMSGAEVFVCTQVAVPAGWATLFVDR